jgi:hypothetical protein
MHLSGRILLGGLCLSLVIATFVCGYGWLNLGTRWWFEDDPMQVAFVAGLPNVWAVLYDPKVASGFGAGNALAPLLILSFAFDLHLGGAHPAVFYLHNVALTAAVVVSFFLVLCQQVSRTGVSFLAAILFLYSPATLVLLQYVSARHYLQGALAFLLVVGASQSRARWAFPGLVVCAVLGLMTKELWAALILTYLFVHGVSSGRRGLMVLSILLAGIYFLYRSYLLGIDLGYQAKPPSLFDFWHFLGVIPYGVTANRAGFLVLGGLIFVLGWLGGRGRLSGFGREHWSWGILLAVSVGVLLPVSHSILVTYIEPNPWYRVFIGFNIIAGILLVRLCLVARLPRLYSLGVAAILTIGIAYGAHKTRVWWLERSGELERAGRFIHENPTKVLYTEDLAFWFLPGVERLYGLPEGRFLNPYFERFAADRAKVDASTDLYREREGAIVPAPEKRGELIATRTGKGFP